MVYCNSSMTSLFVLVAVIAVTVHGKPHQSCLPDDDYARTVLARYLSGNQYGSPPKDLANEATAVLPFDYEAAAPRSGRSNERDFKSDDPSLAFLPPLQHRQPAASPMGHHFGIAASSTVVKPSTLCKGTTRPGVNDTLSTATIEKLAAYYEQLKGQQDMLTRQQVQQQVYEQQQRRQQEYMLMQQQIQQQYYQQQQHVLLMLEQLRKNPAFASQFAAFVDQKRAEAGNAIGAVPKLAGVVKEMDDDRHKLPLNEINQVIANHVDKDVIAEDRCIAANVKRLEARRATEDEVSDKGQDASEDRDPTEDQRPTFEDDQTPPVLEKVYSMVTE